MKKILIGAIIIILSFTITLPLFADDNKIDDKYDLVGTYQNHSSTYAWGDIPSDAMWNYKIHIKVAKDPAKSKGMVRFSTDGVEVVGHVEGVKMNYKYWSGENLAVVGWANYNGQKYYFMLLYKASAVWFCLSDTPYDDLWSTGSVYQGAAQRLYQTHSLNPGTSLEFGCKDIH